MRLFIAIALTDPVRAALEALQRRLRPLDREVRWVPPAQMHLTLVFLGERDGALVPDLAAILDRVAAAYGAFACTVAQAGLLTRRNLPPVIVAGIAPPAEALAALQAALVDALERDAAITRETRPFVPHLTLGRGRSRDTAPALVEALRAAATWTAGTLHVAALTLYRSHLDPDGAVHTPLHAAALNV